jgi:hypothetical protein
MATRTEGYRERLNQIEMNGLKFANPTQGMEAEANLEEHKSVKREQDMNNPGRDAFDAKHDSQTQPTVGMPLASPKPIDIPESPVNVKIDLSDAVNFIRQWEGVKSGEMRPAFAESHLKNIAMENYLAELKARTQAAQQIGQNQIILPMMPQGIYAGEAKTANREDDDYGKKIMATLAPFIATQKLFGMGDDNTQAEKPTEVAKTIMDMGKSMAELKGNNQAEQPKITEVIDSVISAAEKLSGGSGGGKSKTEELTEIIKIAEMLSNRKDDSGKINVPNPDGTITEMPASQYLISQLLAAKNEGGKSSEGVKPDMVTITDPEGNVKHMPTAVYMAEQMMNKGKDNQGDNAGRDEPPTSKLLSALVGTVERLSTNMNDMQRRLSEQSNPLGMMKRLKQESDEWNQFREGFMGSAGTTQTEREAMEEKKREHELELEKINARKESSMALASMMKMQQPTPVDTAPELNTAEDFQRDMNERLLLSQQKAKAFSNFNVQPQANSEIVKDTGGEKKKHGRKQ